MSVNYSITEINTRLQGTVQSIGQAGNGFLKLQSASGATVSSIQLNNPCGVVSNGVLVFTGSLIDPSAAGGTAVSAVVTDTNNNVMISGLTVSSAAPADIILSQTLIPAGTVVQLLSAQITGS